MAYLIKPISATTTPLLQSVIFTYICVAFSSFQLHAAITVFSELCCAKIESPREFPPPGSVYVCVDGYVCVCVFACVFVLRSFSTRFLSSEYKSP